MGPRCGASQGLGTVNRSEMVARCHNSQEIWDVLVIGGGATGLGAALDAASRGYKTLLLEQNDFAKGTSSRSTKLIHGGLRYLKQGNIKLVKEALRERGLLCQNAPHLVSHLGFLVPYTRWWERPFYTLGLKVYDLLAGSLGIEKSRHLDREAALAEIPTLAKKDLKGAGIYYDGQFDDARLAIVLARTCVDLGGTVLNYVQVDRFLKEEGKIKGVYATDLESNSSFCLRAKTVINATGVFSDQLRRIDDPSIDPLIAPSQGIHLVLDRSFMPSLTAVLIPSTEDGRVLFFVPWHQHLLVGTTDTPVSQVNFEPKPFSEEIDFLLKHAARYLQKAPTRQDIRSVFAGLRPLVRARGKTKKTATLSRDHFIAVSDSGLITITGGKWTTYRKMAQDVIDQAIQVGSLPKRPCATHHLRLHGYRTGSHALQAWLSYGSDAEHLESLIQQNPAWKEPLHPALPYRAVEVIWAVRQEMARTLEDVLARRTRALFLDAQASLAIAPQIAHWMAKELNQDSEWEKKQLQLFTQIASHYLPR